jgi:hypothetical protein
LDLAAALDTDAHAGRMTFEEVFRRIETLEQTNKMFIGQLLKALNRKYSK